MQGLVDTDLGRVVAQGDAAQCVGAEERARTQVPCGLRVGVAVVGLVGGIGREHQGCGCDGAAGVVGQGERVVGPAVAVAEHRIAQQQALAATRVAGLEAQARAVQCVGAEQAARTHVPGGGGIGGAFVHLARGVGGQHQWRGADAARGVVDQRERVVGAALAVIDGDAAHVHGLAGAHVAVGEDEAATAETVGAEELAAHDGSRRAGGVGAAVVDAVHVGAAHAQQRGGDGQAAGDFLAERGHVDAGGVIAGVAPAGTAFGLGLAVEAALGLHVHAAAKVAQQRDGLALVDAPDRIAVGVAVDAPAGVGGGLLHRGVGERARGVVVVDLVVGKDGVGAVDGAGVAAHQADENAALGGAVVCPDTAGTHAVLDQARVDASDLPYGTTVSVKPVVQGCC
ncbi:hypothetical protein FQZ97_762470 [compost metagenome]